MAVDFQELVANAPDVVAILDRDRRYIYVNDAVAQLGRTPAQLIGALHDDVMPPDAAALWRDAITQVVASGEPRQLECTLETARGPRQFASLVSPFERDRVCVVTRDVTDVRSRRLLDTAVRAMTTGFAIAEAPSGRILFMNAEAWRLFGPHDGELPDAVAYDQLAKQLDQQGRVLPPSAWPLARAITGEVVTETILVQLRDGSRRTLTVNASPVRDANNTLIAAVATFSDVTESDQARRAAEEARDRTRRLQQLTDALSTAIERDEVIASFIEAGRSALGAGASFAWLLRDEHTLELVSMKGGESAPVHASFRSIPTDAGLPICEATRTGEPLMFGNDAEMQRAFPRTPPRPGSPYRSWAVVPFVVGGAGIGAASFSMYEERVFTSDDRELLVAMAGQASLALERCRLVDAERRARAEAEAARERERQSEQRLRDALRAARAGTWSVDLATMTSVRDPSYEALVGPRAETSADFMMIHPDDRAIAREAFERTLRERVPYEPVVRVVRSDGSYMWVEAHGNLSYDSDGKPVTLSGVIVDVDEAKHASLRAEEERRMSETMHRLASSFASELDHDKLVQRIVDELAKAVGAETARFSPGADGLVAPLPPSHLEVPVVSRSGETFGYLVFGHGETAHFTEEHQRLVSSVASHAAVALENARLYRDVRTHKEQLEVAVERARAADRRKDEFLAMLGHELRNPLAPIVSALDLVELKQITGIDKEREILRRQVSHLSRLIDDLLDVSRITRGKIQLDMKTLALADVIHKAIEMASPLIEKRLQHLDVDLPADGVLVDADATRLAQVFQNLLTNASKYSDPRSRIAVRASVTESDVTVSVRDHGVGISPVLLPRLFDMFVQGERAIDRAEGGLGIGLTIARSLCELHGGSIAAASDGLGKGSTFSVTLPRSLRTRVTTDAMPPLRPPTSTGSRVLVVDDNVDAAHMIREVLSALGHQLEVAHDGPSALELAAAFKPDVCVLDIGLPVMSGYELAQKLRERLGTEKLRLIAVSGYGQDADRARSREVGFEHHLVKPVHLDALLALLGK